MRKSVRIILTLVLSIVALCSCSDERFISPFTGQADRVCLVHKSTTVLTYNPASCQMAYNADRHEFRVHSDNMSDFYMVTLDKLPRNKNEHCEGDLIWTTRTDVFTKKHIPFTVVKTEGDMIWLWSAKTKLGVVIKLLY